MSRNLYFVGTAGSGKTTLVGAYASWMNSQGLDCVKVNLDPGAGDLPYEPDVDIRDWISVPEIMKEQGLGPNGAQVAAADMLALNAGEVAEVLEKYETPYFLIDTPGQLELFALREASRAIIRAFGEEDSALLYLVDPITAKQPSGFVTSMLLSATTQFRHRLPFFGVLAKADLLEEEDLNKVLRWSQDPFALYEALTDDKSEPGTVKVVLDSEFLRAMEEMGLYRKLVPVSATLPFGLEEVYSLLQQAFEGGEDLRPD